MRFIAILTGAFILLTCSCQSKTTSSNSNHAALATNMKKVATPFLGNDSLDEQDRKIMQKFSPTTVQRMDRGDPITVFDVIHLHEGGISDDTILRYMGQTRASYSLSQEQIKLLQHAGVSQRVINHMIDTGR